tara:strand:+ start:21733 stop:22359 length:627 start_codon:yes stop_codon:yes gene_type:complete
MSKIRLFVCDDETAIRVSIGYLVKDSPMIELIGTSGSMEDCIEKICPLYPDVAIVDIFMKSKYDGLRTCEEIKKICPETKIIAYSAFFDRHITKNLTRIGVNGFVDKGSEMEIILSAIELVYKGEEYVCPISSASHELWKKTSRTNLSNQQIDVIKLIAKGLSNQEIADEMKLSSSTIKTQRQRIMKKLDAHNTAQLILNGEQYLITP